MKPTITRVGERITKIRFKTIQDKSVMLAYGNIVDQLPHDTARSQWIAAKKRFSVIDGWAEVTPV